MCGTEPGSLETYAEQVCLPINGKVRSIDRCIHHIVAALNAGGVDTTACCCGHGKMPGRIDLADGRVLVIMTEDQAKEVVRQYMKPAHTQPAVAAVVVQDHEHDFRTVTAGFVVCDRCGIGWGERYTRGCQR